MTKFGNSALHGPYEAEIRYDDSVRDNCHAQLENKSAFRKYAEGDEILLKVELDGNVVKFTDDVKKKHDRWKYASIPIDKREKLGIQPHDTVKFWLKGVKSGVSEKVAIKAGSKVYHKMKNGEIICNHHHATKPGTTDNGLLTAEVDEIGEDWKLCDSCDRMETATKVTYDDLIAIVKELIKSDSETQTFSSKELIAIIEELSDSETIEKLMRKKSQPKKNE